MFDELSQDMFIRCQSRIQHVFDEHKARVLNLERLKTEGCISIEDGGASNSTSRLSARLDSPDTTDSSRPDTGNATLKNNDAIEDFGFRFSGVRMSDALSESQALTTNVDIVDNGLRQIHQDNGNASPT